MLTIKRRAPTGDDRPRQWNYFYDVRGGCPRHPKKLGTQIGANLSAKVRSVVASFFGGSTELAPAYA